MWVPEADCGGWHVGVRRGKLEVRRGRRGVEKEWEEEKVETRERGDKTEEEKMCKCWGRGDNEETRLKGEERGS